jgi:glutathione synthase/RimK-type ligase-like ATP-grasp enzyme
MTDRTVLLATSSDWPAGEPGGPALNAALAARGLAGRWVCWDDATVDWASADLVAVRSTWDYMGRPAEFLDWARRVEQEAPLLNGADVFAWNLDKEYLTRLGADGDGDFAVVPTMLADHVPELAAAVERFGTAVVKPRVGAGGAGVLVVDDPRDPRLGREGLDHPLLPAARGPWIVQPLVESVRTTGETSVFVLDGVAVSQVDKVPGPDEIRVHEHFGGSSAPVALSAEAAEVSMAAVRAAAGFAGRPLDYARVDLLQYAGSWAVSELEVTEPGLYLDVLPENADPFADLVVSRLV